MLNTKKFVEKFSLLLVNKVKYVWIFVDINGTRQAFSSEFIAKTIFLICYTTQDESNTVKQQLNFNCNGI